jgi:hypothetical protein
LPWNYTCLCFASELQYFDDHKESILRHQGILEDYTLLPVRSSRAKRFKGPFGEKRRSISGIVIDTDQFKQTKAGG